MFYSIIFDCLMKSFSDPRTIVALILFVSYIMFSAWVYTSGTDKVSELGNMSEAAYKGKLLYHKHNCFSCHQIFGLGGYLGPDLTHVISNPGKGPAYAAAFLKYGSGQMPDFHMDSLETAQIIAYFMHLDSTARLEKQKRTASIIK